MGRILIGSLLSFAVSLFAVSVQAGEVRGDEKFLWSSYMICFPINGNFRPYKDRPLDRPSVGSNPQRVDLENGVAAGVDAFSVDLFIADKNALPAFGQMVKLVNENHLPIQFSPMFDGLGFPGVGVSDIVAKVQQWFEKFAKEPCVVRFEGKPVIFTFAAYSVPPQQWREIFDRLRAAGYEGYWVAEMTRKLGHPSTDLPAARAWLDLLQAGNIFHIYDSEKYRETVSIYHKAYPSPPHQWVGDTNIGYWRPEVAVYSSQKGTGQFCETWQLANECGTNWVQQSTWNDFSENHHIMPSENYSTTFAELNCFLAAQWKGRPEALDAPRLYLSQQQEVLTGEEAEFELLALLRPRDLPATLALQVTDGEGRIVKAFEPVQVAQAGMQVAEFKLPVPSQPSGRLLFPEGRLLDSAGKPALTVRGPYTIVSPGGYRPERNYSWLHTPAHRQISGVKCEIMLDGQSAGSMAQAQAKGAVSFQVSSPVELADVEILHDGVQLLSLRRDLKESRLISPVTWHGQLQLNRRGRLDWGAYAVRAVTADGRIATSLPIFVERPPEADVTLGLWTFDSDTNADVLDGSPWLHDGWLGGRTRWEVWRPKRVLDAWGGKCLKFDGVDDRVLLEGPIVPPNAYTVECWVRPEPVASGGSKGQIIFATASAAVVMGVDSKGALFLSRKSGDKWCQVRNDKPVTLNQWQHVAATYDGATLGLYQNGRLVGEKAAPGGGKCGQVSIGYNSVTEGSFYCGEMDELRLSGRALRPEEFGPHNPLKH
jgi:hypothetical protein